MKKQIHLNESELHRLINESVKKVLKEIDSVPKIRKRNSVSRNQQEFVAPEKRNYWDSDIEQYYQDNYGKFKSDIPKEWLTNDSLRKAYTKGIKLTTPKNDKNGFDKETGLHKDTGTNYDPEGYNKLGIDKNGFKRDGRGLSSFDEEGYNKLGFDKNGFKKIYHVHSWEGAVKHYVEHICSPFKITMKYNVTFKYYNGKYVKDNLRVGKYILHSINFEEYSEPTNFDFMKEIKYCAKQEAKKIVDKYNVRYKYTNSHRTLFWGTFVDESDYETVTKLLIEEIVKVFEWAYDKHEKGEKVLLKDLATKVIS